MHQCIEAWMPSKQTLLSVRIVFSVHLISVQLEGSTDSIVSTYHLDAKIMQGRHNMV